MFMDFVRFLDSAEDAQFQAEVTEYVDVDAYLRFLALEALLSNLDSPLMTSQNYYLYLHPKTRRFVWVPWDLNEPFGGFGPAGNATEQANLSLDQPFTRVNRFAGRMLQKPGVMERYHEILRSLLADHFNAARIFPVIDAIARTIRPALTDDSMVSMNQFEAALSQSSAPETVAGSVVKTSEERPPDPGAPGGSSRSRPALKAFIDQRVHSAMLQLEGKMNGLVPREVGPRPGGPRPVASPPTNAP